MLRGIPFISALPLWLGLWAGCETGALQTAAPEPRPLGNDLPAFRAPADPEAAPPASEAAAEPADLLTLRDALALALMRNPELASYSWEVRAAEARLLQAKARPNPELGLSLEDFAGTGARAGFKAVEAALELSQVVELGGKRLKRAQAAQYERDLAAWDYEAKRLDVYTRTAQAFVDVLAAGLRLDLAQENLQLAERTFEAVRERVRAGKDAPLEEAKARVMLTTEQLAAQGAEREAQVARRALAAMWGGADPRFARVEGDLGEVRPAPSFESLMSHLAQNPDLARWAAEMALRRAVISLEEARSIPDLAVGAGVKHSEEFDDRTGILGFSIPLPLFDRNQGGILEARYRLAQSEEDRRGIEARVKTELYRTWHALAQAREEAEVLQAQALPAARRAFQAAEEGYKAGKWGYLEVLDAQRTLFGVQAQKIDALTRYHKALAEAERLIGQDLDSINPSPVAAH